MVLILVEIQLNDYHMLKLTKKVTIILVILFQLSYKKNEMPLIMRYMNKLS